MTNYKFLILGLYFINLDFWFEVIFGENVFKKSMAFRSTSYFKLGGLTHHQVREAQL
jgi:hypothetical protein